MVDVESRVFTAVHLAVTTSYPSAKVESTLNLSPSAFPFVSVEEIDNQTYDGTVDSESNENHVAVTYEVNVYSNKAEGKKAEAKAIFTIIDDVMLGMGFTRSMRQPVNMDDSTKYRIISRYRAVISKDYKFYRR